MKVFIAGATGAIGKQLVPMLVERGHEVTGMTRTSAKQDLIRGLGARPVVADALDPEGVARAVAEAEPEVVIHQLTAIDASRFGRSLDKTFALTNRLRTEGTDHLLAAANAAGARRFIAQSFRGLALRADRRSDQDRGGSASGLAPEDGQRDPRGDQVPGGDGYGSRGNRGTGPPLRRLLWSRDVPGREPGQRAGRDGPEAPLPDRRQRRRDLVAGAHPRRGRGPPPPRWGEASPACTTWSTTSPRRCPSRCRSWHG